MRRKGFSLPVIILVLIISSVSILGLFLFKYAPEGGEVDTYYPQVKQNNESSPVLAASPTIFKSDTGVSEYQSNQFGFKIIYNEPVTTSFTSYNSNLGGSSILGITGPTQREGTDFYDGFSMFVSKAEGESLLEAAVQGQESTKPYYANNCEFNFTETEITIGNGVKAVNQIFDIIDCKYEGTGDSVHIYFHNKNNDIVRLSAIFKGVNEADYKKIFDEIISNLELIN